MIKKIIKSFIDAFNGYCNGLETVMKFGFKKPVTLEYPEKKKQLNEKFRGKLQLKRNENNELACLGCGMCVQVCPTKGALNIIKEKDENGKLRVKEFDIDMSQCIFCGNCTEVCPGKNIFMTQEFELATENKSDLYSKYFYKENN